MRLIREPRTATRLPPGGGVQRSCATPCGAVDVGPARAPRRGEEAVGEAGGDLGLGKARQDERAHQDDVEDKADGEADEDGVLRVPGGEAAGHDPRDEPGRVEAAGVAELAVDAIEVGPEEDEEVVEDRPREADRADDAGEGGGRKQLC